MGFVRGCVGMRFLMMNLESMNYPSAPESMRAVVETVWSCTFSEIGMRNADSDSSALST